MGALGGLGALGALGAFAFGTVINIEITVSRRIGASGVVLRLCRDGGRDLDTPLDFCRTDNLEDVYSTVLDTKKLCGDDGEGLFYYEFLFLRGTHTLFTDSLNNKDFALVEEPGFRFRLLVYKECGKFSIQHPSWWGNGW